MSGGKIGEFRLFEYYGTRNEAPLLGPLRGVPEGISVTHSAAMITFNAGALDRSYIERLKALNTEDSLVFREIHDRSGNVTSYELNYSFWPKEEWAAASNGSRLQSFEQDCQVSELGSPMQYSAEAAAYFNPHKEVVHSGLPFFDHLPGKTINLPPSIVLHATPLGAKYGPTAEKQAMDFAIKYEAWRRLSIENKNRPTPLQKVLLDRAQKQMLDSQNALQKLMFGDKQMTHAAFMAELRPFVTFGNTPRDIVTLPISNDPNNNNALQLQGIIDEILSVGEDHVANKYNLITNNCANKTHAALVAGIPKGASLAFRTALEFNPEMLGMLPGRVQRMAAALSKVIDRENEEKSAGKGEGLVGHGVQHHHNKHTKEQLKLSGLAVANDENHNPNHPASTARKSKLHNIPKPKPPFVDTTTRT